MKIILPAVFFLLFFGLVNGYIHPENERISMERNSSANILVFIENPGYGSNVFLSANSHSPFISAEPSIKEFYLNKDESTWVNVRINSSNDAPIGSYSVELKADFGGTVEKDFIEVNVAAENNFSDEVLRLTPFEKKLCLEEEGRIRVKVENLSSLTQEVNFSAEDEAFIPLVEPESTELGPFESTYIELVLHPNSTYKAGDYSVLLKARTSNSIISKTVNFELSECEEERDKLFDLRLGNECVHLEKDSPREIGFTLENTSSEEQTVSISIVSDLGTKNEHKKVLLEKGEKRYLYFTAEADSDDETGRHEIEVWAFNDSYSEKGIACVYIEKMHSLGIKIIKNNLEIERCSTGVFELQIDNNGDYDEEVRASVSSKPEEVEMKFSEKNFVIEKGKKKILYVSVSPSLEAELGEEKVSVRIRNSDSITKTLNFTILRESEDKRISAEEAVEFLSFPEKIHLEKGKNSEFLVSIKNISGKELNGVNISVKGLPAGILMDEINVSSIGEDDSIEVKGKIYASEYVEEGTYEGKIVVENSSFRQEKDIRVEVGETSSTQGLNINTKIEKQEGILSGLLGLIGFNGGGLGGIISALILVLVLLIVLLIALGSRVTPRRRARNILVNQ